MVWDSLPERTANLTTQVLIWWPKLGFGKEARTVTAKIVSGSSADLTLQITTMHINFVRKMVYGNDENQRGVTVVVRKDDRPHSLLVGLEDKVLVPHGMVTTTENQEDKGQIWLDSLILVK